jgi:hypothetical protein
MITGAHTIINSTNADADRKLLRDIFKLPFVDMGGFQIFGLPPAEVAIHEASSNGGHEFWFMCENIAAFTGEMTKRGVPFSTPANRGWGTATQITLPGGGTLGVYQPHHPRPKAPRAAAAAKKPAAKKKKVSKKAATRKSAKKTTKKKTAKRGKRR